MNRRTFLGLGVPTVISTLIASAASLPALAQSPRYAVSPGLQASATGIVAVMLANFQCAISRAVNDHFPRLKQAALDAGMDLRFAPVAWESQPIWPDRVYYAARDLFPGAEQLVRDTLFDGVHREQMAFEDLPQVIAYLDSRQIPYQVTKAGLPFDISEVAERAYSEASLMPEVKASRLLTLSAAEQVPVFVWVRGGDVIHVVSPQEGQSPIALSQTVYKTMQSGLQHLL